VHRAGRAAVTDSRVQLLQQVKLNTSQRVSIFPGGCDRYSPHLRALIGGTLHALSNSLAWVNTGSTQRFEVRRDG